MYEIKEESLSILESESMKANCVLEDLTDLFMQKPSKEDWELLFIERERIYWKLQIIDDAIARIMVEVQKAIEQK